MNKRKFLNSKWEKITVGILATLVVAFTVLFACMKIAKRDIDVDLNIDSGDVGFKENKNDISGEKPFKKLSENEFIFDKEAKTISLDKSLVGGSFCISTSPDAPTESDPWKVIENESINLSEEEQAIVDNSEEQKIYIYYMSSTFSTMTTFNENAEIYTISTYDELQTFKTKVNGGTNFSGKKVILLRDISLGLGVATLTEGIGTSTYPFKGTFDGCGYTISGFIGIAPPTGYANLGLFGYVIDGTIKNLTVTGNSISAGAGESVGAIAGYMTGTLKNCKSSVKDVSGGTAVGGLVGSFGGTIEYCQNTSNISATGECCGGIVGKLIAKTTIFNCNNSGTLTSSAGNMGGILGSTNAFELSLSCCTNSGSGDSTAGNVGGIIGTIGQCTDYGDIYKILNCKNTGYLEADDYNVGGIIGRCSEYTRTKIQYCINEGNLYVKKSAVGGIVGRGAGQITEGDAIGYQGIYIYNCFNEGNIQAGEQRAGGILGYDGDRDTTYISEVKYCGNTGDVLINKNDDGSNDNHQCVGGIVGRMSDGVVEYCYSKHGEVARLELCRWYCWSI